MSDEMISRLLGPDGPEIGCDECFALLDRYVETELAGENPETVARGMGAHLSGCPACREEYDSLKALLS